MTEEEREEEAKPTKITLTVTIPTEETIVDALKRMFPMLEVEIVKGKPKEEAPAEET